MTELKTIKVVLLGAESVGKTSIIDYYMKHSFSEQVTPTVGVAIFQLTVQVQDRPVKLSIWDTAGQERYQGLAPMYYRDANLIIFTIDSTNPKSFDYIQTQLPSVRSLCDNAIFRLKFLFKR